MAEALEAKVGEALRKHGWTLALGESCTGGLLGHRITNVPSSSDYFVGGYIAYAYEGMARAQALNENLDEARRFFDKAQAVGDTISDAESKDIFSGDLVSGDWFGHP